MRQKEMPNQIIEVNFPVFEKGKIGKNLRQKWLFGNL